MFVTNQSTIVSYAKLCCAKYPTIVNALRESGITYPNTKSAYAQMDSKFAKSQLGIGWASNLAQLAMTYYWTEKQSPAPDPARIRQFYDNFIILSVLAQIIIDGCKREYEIDGMEEIKRIQAMECMRLTKNVISPEGKIKKVRCDYPMFMRYTKEIPLTKDGKELPAETIHSSRESLMSRLNSNLVCPMNWLQSWLDQIPNASTSKTIPTIYFFIKKEGKPNNRQMTKIQEIVKHYDLKIIELNTKNIDGDEYTETLIKYSEQMLSALRSVKIGNPVTMNRLIETSLGLAVSGRSRASRLQSTKYTRKILNALYRMDPDKFLANFESQLPNILV